MNTPKHIERLRSRVKKASKEMLIAEKSMKRHAIDQAKWDLLNTLAELGEASDTFFERNKT